MQIVDNFDFLLHQMEMKSAYLHAPLKCDIHVCQPAGYEKLDKNSDELVWDFRT